MGFYRILLNIIDKIMDEQNSHLNVENPNNSENVTENESFIQVSIASRNGDVVDVELKTQDDLELYAILVDFELTELMMILKRMFFF